MPAPKQLVDLPLAIGLDTKTDPKLSQGLLSVKNGDVRKTGLIRKRRDFAPLSRRSIDGGITETAGSGYRPTEARFVQGYGIYSVNDRLMIAGRDRLTTHPSLERNLNTGDVLSSYRPKSNRWQPLTPLSPISAKTYRIGEPGNASDPSIAIAAGYRVSCAGSTLYITDDVTGAVIWKVAMTAGPLKGYFLTTNTGPKFVGVAGKKIITWDTASPQTAPVESAGPNEANTVAGGEFDVAPSADNTALWYASMNSTLLKPAVYKLDATGAITAGPTNTTALYINNSPVKIFSLVDSTRAEKIILVWQVRVTGNLGLAQLTTANAVSSEAVADAATFTTSTWTSVSGCPIDIVTGGAFADGAFMLAVTDANATKEDRLTHFATWQYNGTKIAGTERNIRHVSLVGDLFACNGRVYAPVANISTYQTTFFLYSLHSLEPITAGTSDDLHVPQLCLKLFYGRSADAHNNASFLSAVVRRPSSNTFVLALAKFDSLIVFNSFTAAITTNSVTGVELTFGDAAPKALEFGAAGIIPGGVVSMSDGAWEELGFHIYPENITLANLGTLGGDLSAAGTYNFIVIARWVDRTGHIHRSAPSLPQSIALNINQSVGVTVKTLSSVSIQKYKSPSITLEIYRTVAGGSTYFLSNYAAVSPTDATSYTQMRDLNSTGSGGTTTGVNDTSLQAREQLYTNSGELEVIAPPAGNLIAAGSDRVFLIPFDDPTTVWYTKPKTETFAPEFVDGQYVRIETDGDNTGVVVMDGQQIVFKNKAIYVFGGDGPNSLGQGTFFTPRKLASPVGCIDPRSLVATSDGIIFRSESGYYFLDRSLQVQPIGTPVAAYADFDVADACIVPALEQVWIALKGQKTILVFDYLHKIWGTHEVSGAIAGLVCHQGLVHILGADGTVGQYDATKPADAALFLSTPWYKAQGLQALQKIWWLHLLGELDAAFKVTIYYDYKDGAQDYKQVIKLASKSGRTLVRIKPAKRKCVAFRVDIEQIGKLSLDIGLNALSLAIAPLGRLARLASAETK